MDFENIHNWGKYDPEEQHYFLYPTNITATMFQIVGVYETFCNARANLEYINCDNYGQLIGKTDDLHLSYVRKMFIQNALIYYNISIDLSWQVLWMYTEENNLGLIYDDKYLNKVLRKCNYQELLYRLHLGRKNDLIDIINKFNLFIEKNGMREKYNYLKHRGVYYYPGLGVNDNEMIMSLNNFTPKMLNRLEIEISSWVEMLQEFDKSFVQYFNSIIDYIVPKNYFDLGNVFQYSMQGLIYSNKIKEYLMSKEDIVKKGNIINMYSLSKIKELSYNYENEIIKEFKEFFKVLIDEKNSEISIKDKKIQFKKIGNLNDLKKLYNNPGFYVIISNFNIENNDSKFTINQDGKELKAIYRGEANSRRDRLTGHLFRSEYSGTDKNFMKIGNDNGINIDKAPYCDYEWFVMSCSMQDSNQQIRRCMEKAFDLVYEKPIYSKK